MPQLPGPEGQPAAPRLAPVLAPMMPMMMPYGMGYGMGFAGGAGHLPPPYGLPALWPAGAWPRTSQLRLCVHVGGRRGCQTQQNRRIACTWVMQCVVLSARGMR